MCRLGCVSVRLETSQHLPWICCDQNCCFPASRQLSELPWGGGWHRCGGPGGQLWALLGLCRLSLLFPAARCDVCSGSEWLVVALHGQLLRCKGAFSTLLLEFLPGALRFPPHGEPSSSSVGSAVGNSGEGGGELCPLQGICSPKCREFWAFLAASLHAVHQGQVLTETLNARGNTGSSCLTASVTQTGPFHSAL